jgi:alpha-amylase
MTDRNARAACIGLVAFACVPLVWAAQPLTPPRNTLVYEIFVRSFADGDDDPKGIGDLKGVRGKLDSYLNDGKPETDHDLEVGILWLMPLFPASSYHGYDVTDFRDVNPEYGDLADLEALVAEARTRGVRIILDAPFNHTSDEHPWFKEAVSNPHSPRRKYYVIEPDTGSRGAGWHAVSSPSGEKLRYLGLFSPKMPDLNFDNPDVRREIRAIAKFWLDLGVAGFRLDAAKHIYGDRFDQSSQAEILRNNEWWREFSHFVYRERPDALLVGEVLGDPELLRRHTWGLDALVDEPYMNGARAQALSPTPGFVGRHKLFVEQARELNRTAYDESLPFPDQPFHAWPYLASHDRNPRLASDLDAMRDRGMCQSVDEAYRLALYLLLSMPSHPVLYAGDEVMQRGWKWNGNPRDHRDDPGDGSGIYDETLREPFPWFASGRGAGQTRWFPPRFDGANDGVSREEQDRPRGMLNLVRGLTNLRSRHAALASGDLGAILSDSVEWLVFERTLDGAQYLVLINRTPAGHNYVFHAAWFPHYRGSDLIFWSDGRAREWKDLTADGPRIGDSVFVPPYGLVVLRRRQ